jgi:hypothetical protein
MYANAFLRIIRILTFASRILYARETIWKRRAERIVRIPAKYSQQDGDVNADAMKPEMNRNTLRPSFPFFS